jgi:MraZ protein
MSIDSPTDRMWGRFDHGMDDKNRVVLPQRFREKLGDEFVLTQGPSHSIRAYPMRVWSQLEEIVASRDALDEFDSSTQFLQRMLGNCEFVTLDAQFRVTIPRGLKEWAELTDEAPTTFIGSGSRVEIWKKPRYQELSESCTFEAVSAASTLRLTGIEPDGIP